MLEEALTSFPGTVLAVSHDRYFLRRISTRVLEVGGGVVTDYEGDYETYLNRNDDAAEKQAERDDQKRELEKSQIKAKSKMSKAEKARHLGGLRGGESSAAVPAVQRGRQRPVLRRQASFQALTRRCFPLLRWRRRRTRPGLSTQRHRPRRRGSR